jgi:lysophospholipid acyltransferase (LPLAT)-like uncharacterized protein
MATTSEAPHLVFASPTLVHGQCQARAWRGRASTDPAPVSVSASVSASASTSPLAPSPKPRYASPVPPLLGLLLGLFVRLYLRTLRLSLHLDPALPLDDPRPWVLCFWHGDQFALLRWKRRRPTVALVSHSRDGQMQARALTIQGLLVERGSSSRGGSRGLRAIVRHLRAGHDAAFAVDGPRGPRFSVAPGALTAADVAGGRLVPMGSAAPHGVTLQKAWDRFRIPLPFSRVAVALGAPLEPAGPADLEPAIHRASAEARAMLASPGDALLRHARRA